MPDEHVSQLHPSVRRCLVETTQIPTLDQARAALAQQPFSQLLGTRLTRFGSGVATLELDVSERLTQQHRFVHGGVVSYLIDNAITFAAGLALGADVVTAGFTVDYLRPARGVRVTAEANVIRAGATQAVMQCTVHVVDTDGRARLCAVGQGRVSRRAARA